MAKTVWDFNMSTDVGTHWGHDWQENPIQNPPHKCPHLQVDPIQGQAVQAAEQLVLVVGVEPLDHVKVVPLWAAPWAGGDLAVVEAELGHAAVRAEPLLHPLKLHHMWGGLQGGAQRATKVTGAHVQLVGILECREARVAAQVVEDAVVLHCMLDHLVLKDRKSSKRQVI